MLRMILFSFGILAAMPAHAQTANCNRPQSQVEYNLCAKSDFDEADAALNRNYKNARRVLKRMDSEAADLLRTAQRAWIPYRDAACDTEASLFKGGSMQPQVYWGCLARLTRLRSDDLQDLVAR